MKAISLLLFILACSHSQRPLQDRQLIQCYLESDTYMEKKPFEVKMSLNLSEMGTVLNAKVVNASEKDPNLNSCLSYVVMGAGRPFNMQGKSGPMEKNLKFRPDGKHEL
jgi:hypothetical protein